MGDDVTTCCVLNKHDDQLIILFTEWLESSFKTTVFNPKTSTLVGEMSTSQVDNFATNRNRTRDEYLQEARNALSGKEKTIEFISTEQKLRWKSGAWNHGIMELKQVPLQEVFLQILEKLVTRQTILENQAEELRKENDQSKTTIKELNEKLEAMTNLKNSMEQTLYERFLEVLNSKKARIRELEERSKKLCTPGTSKSVFEADTDGSETSDQDGTENGVPECNKSKGKCNSTLFTPKTSGSSSKIKKEKFSKRHIEDDDEKMIDSDYEETKKRQKNHRLVASKPPSESNRLEVSKFPVNKPSTSKNYDDIETDQVDSDKVEGKVVVRTAESTSKISMLNLTSEESEEDLFA